MTGKIIKGIAGFYYVNTDLGVYECKAKGNFRNKKIKPLVGDNVNIKVLDEDEKLGNIEEILPRTNSLLRPEVCNVDQAMIIFAIKEPNPNFNLLCRFLVRMQREDVDTIICFNKNDLADDSDREKMKIALAGSGCKIIFTSVKNKDGIEELSELLKGKTTVIAGPSGVGKSSTINTIGEDILMETGEISDKIKRGKHTTRHSELFKIDVDTYIMDTPGFTSLYLDEIEAGDLRFYFNEFEEYEGKCRFNGCVHVNEPNCAVKEAVENSKISKLRYDNYIELYNELKEIRRY